VTELKTSILFFLGTSESTKNSEDCGLRIADRGFEDARPVDHQRLVDLHSPLFRSDLSFSVPHTIGLTS
jgi:hypothetical protein